MAFDPLSLIAGKIDIGGIFSGIGQLAKDIRTAITGVDPETRSKIEAKLAEMETATQSGTLAIVLAESQSQDKWTSRGRPLFLYVIYILILSSIPMGILHAFDPARAANITTGFKMWLEAIPQDFIILFGAGYLGYGAFRTYDKAKGCDKK